MTLSAKRNSNHTKILLQKVRKVRNSNGKANCDGFLIDWGNRWLIKLWFTLSLSFLREIFNKYCRFANLCAYQELLAVVCAMRSSRNPLGGWHSWKTLGHHFCVAELWKGLETCLGFLLPPDAAEEMLWVAGCLLPSHWAAAAPRAPPGAASAPEFRVQPSPHAWAEGAALLLLLPVICHRGSAFSWSYRIGLSEAKPGLGLSSAWLLNASPSCKCTRLRGINTRSSVLAIATALL